MRWYGTNAIVTVSFCNTSMIINQFYEHQDGGIYLVMDIATSTVDLSKWVAYRHIAPFEVKVWVRPIDEWTEQRFTAIQRDAAYAAMDRPVEPFRELVTACKKRRKQRELDEAQSK